MHNIFKSVQCWVSNANTQTERYIMFHNTALKMIESRVNVTYFLHNSRAERLNDLLIANVSKMSFKEVCDVIFSQYNTKEISNKVFSECIEIVTSENTRLKIESHRIDNTGKIYEYRDGAYHFLKMGTKKEFKNLNHYIS